MTTTIWRNANVATFCGDTPYGWLPGATIVTRGNEVIWLGADRDLPATLVGESANEHHLGGACVTPGLIDCHTHLVYAGNRAREFELRLQGATYEEIARAGGGIRSTAATREASDDQLLSLAVARAKALMREGVTAVEIKSGYGLSEVDEARCLRMARRVGEALPLTVRTTFLGAHAIPPEFDQRADDYVAAVCDWMPRLHAEGLIDAVDAFCERIGFTVAQTRQVFERARSLGLPVKLHAEQLSDQHGAALAAEFAALSCDHLEYVGSDGIAAMASAGTVAVLLPGAYYFCARHSCRRLRRCARRACPLRWRPTTIRFVAHPVAAPDDEHGMHAVPHDAGRSVARVHRQRGAGTGLTARVRSAGRWCAPTLPCGTRSIRVTWSIASAIIHCNNWIQGGQRVAID
jgi:imidazolonepropionase